jgi:CheY-like chemotaxis protein
MTDLTSIANRWPNKVVLVVEDDNFSFQYIEAILKGTGLTIIHVKRGEDAVNTCRSNENIDLVLMDIQLPFMTGYEATKQIRAIRRDLPIIAQSANVLDDEWTKAINAGCNYYTSKPIDSEELLSIISKCMDRINKYFSQPLYIQ